VADRIRMFVVASEGLKAAVEEHRDYVTSETLTVDLQFMPPPADAFTASDSFDGETLTVGLVKA